MGQAQPPISSVTQQLNESVSAVATAGGTATFTFQNPPTGLVWTGTLSCTGAPASATFLAAIGGTTWGDWAGNSVAGPVQAYPNQQLVVTATGLTPGTTFLLVWNGSSDAEGSAEPIFPDANSSSVIGSVISQSGAPTTVFGPSVVATSAGTYINNNVVVAPSARTMIISATAASINLQTGGPTVNVLGNQTLNNYYNQPAYLVQTTQAWLVVVPILGSVDSSYTVSLNNVLAGAGNVNVTIETDTAQYDESQFYNGIAQGAQQILLGAGNILLVRGPARLLTADLEVSGAGCTGLLAISGNPIMRRDGTAAIPDPSGSLTFPPNTIIPAGFALTLQQVAAGATIGSATWAYP